MRNIQLRYTNVIFTIFAGCLVLIAARGLRVVQAATAPCNAAVEHVIIDGYEARDGKTYFPAEGNFTFKNDGALRVVFVNESIKTY